MMPGKKLGAQSFSMRRAPALRIRREVKTIPKDDKGQGLIWLLTLALGAAQLFVGLLALILR